MPDEILDLKTPQEPPQTGQPGFDSTTDDIRHLELFDLVTQARVHLHQAFRKPVQPDNLRYDFFLRFLDELDLARDHAAETELMVEVLPTVPEEHSLHRVLPEYARLLRLLASAIDKAAIGIETSRDPKEIDHDFECDWMQMNQPLRVLRRQIRRCQKRVLRKLLLWEHGEDDERLMRTLSDLSEKTCVEPEEDERRASMESLESLDRRVRVVGGRLMTRYGHLRLLPAPEKDRRIRLGQLAARLWGCLDQGRKMDTPWYKKW